MFNEKEKDFLCRVLSAYSGVKEMFKFQAEMVNI